MSKRRDAALEYHKRGRAGKIQVVATKPTATQLDLSLAYTPGVADVCTEIADHPNTAYEYTAKGNLVGVITNGTAVLGLGDIGPLAAKPVMEGKGVLFKRFADIDVFDIEVNEPDAEKFIAIVKAMEPTFGGINLEDIKAPECFVIEDRLRKEMSIPVFHDDQHGTAIITTAALINALELQNKKIEDVRLVVSGAGAASMACTNLFMELGLKRENVVMFDSKGAISKSRESEINEYKMRYLSQNEYRDLAHAMEGADVFLGVSVGGLVTPEMVLAMADRPIVFALANPEPEIGYWEARQIREDIIMATGRSDYPNQVNNVLGFPFIFRGALDAGATGITQEMVHAAVKALANLAREAVPEAVMRAYSGDRLMFGPDYIIPKPFDHRVLLHVAPAVAKAAMDSGAATRPIEDFEEYRLQLEAILGPSRELIGNTMRRARKQQTHRVVFPDGENETILRACEILAETGIAEPILLGPKDALDAAVEEHRINRKGLVLYDQFQSEDFDRYVDMYWRMKQREGYTRHRAWKRMQQRTFYAAMMVHEGKADAFVGGYGRSEAATLETLREIVGIEEGCYEPVGFSVLLKDGRTTIVGDDGFIVDPTVEQLVHIAKLGARTARTLGMHPRVALLSFSNFGESGSKMAKKMAEARRILDDENVDFEFEGEMSAETAFSQRVRNERYPFCNLSGDANVLVMPTLDSARLSAEMLSMIGGAEHLGPILVGLKRPAAILPSHLDASDIVHLTTLTLAQEF